MATTTTNKQRVLRECFIHADDVRYLNHYLQQALDMSRDINPVPDKEMNRWVSFANQVLEHNAHRTYKLYCLLVWIIVLPQFGAYMREYDDAQRYDRFFGVLDAEFTHFLMGRKPDGSLYEKDSSAAALNGRSVGNFVDRMRQHYMYEEELTHTTTLASSKASVQTAQSLALPPPHGSTAIKRQ